MRWSLPDGRVLAVPAELPATEHRRAGALVRPRPRRGGIVAGEGGEAMGRLATAAERPPAAPSPAAREIMDRIIAKALGIPGEAARIGRVLLQRSPLPLAPRHMPAGAEGREAIARAFGDLPPNQRRLLIRELLKRGAADRSIQDAVAATAATGAPAAAFDALLEEGR